MLTHLLGSPCAKGGAIARSCQSVAAPPRRMGTAHEGSADPFLFNDDIARLIVGPLPKHALRPRGRQGKTETIFQAWSTECHLSGTMKTQAAGRGTGHALRVHGTAGRGTIDTHANTLRPDTTHRRALRDLNLKERRGRCGDQRGRFSLRLDDSSRRQGAARRDRSRKSPSARIIRPQRDRRSTSQERRPLNAAP